MNTAMGSESMLALKFSQSRKAYNLAPAELDTFYAGLEGDLDAMYERFKAFRARTDDTDLMLRRGAALNIATVSRLLSEGMIDEARQHIDTLEQEVWVGFLAEGLTDAPENFSDLCIEAGKLLTHSEVDRVILERYARTPEAADTYLEKDSLMLALDLQEDDKYIVAMGYSITEVAGVTARLPNMGAMLIAGDLKFATLRAGYQGSEKGLYTFAGMIAEKQKRKTHQVIITTYESLTAHFMVTYKFEQRAKALRKYLPLQPGDSSEFIEIDTQEKREEK